MNEMVSGFIASTTTTCLFYPIDTLKMRLQHSSTPSALKHFSPLKTHSISSLYRGLPAELTGSIPSSFMFWYSYSQLREKQQFTPFQASVSSALISNFIDTPFDIRKKQRQLQLKTSFSPSIISKFAVANCGHSMLYNGVYMPLLSYLLDKKVPKTLSILTCCTAASIITFPLDRLRTQIVATKQLQTQWWKGLGYRLLFQNLYSGLYMHLYLWLSKNKI
jgi:hypothetical protein